MRASVEANQAKAKKAVAKMKMAHAIDNVQRRREVGEMKMQHAVESAKGRNAVAKMKMQHEMEMMNAAKLLHGGE